MTISTIPDSQEEQTIITDFLSALCGIQILYSWTFQTYPELHIECVAYNPEFEPYNPWDHI